MNRKMLYTVAGLIAFVLIVPMLGWMAPPQANSDHSFKSFQTPTTENAIDISSDFITVADPQTGEKSEVSVEEYLIGVVSAEMPIFFEPEALKAQAVAAHTYALERYSTDNSFHGVEIPTDPSVFQAYCPIDTMREKYGDAFEEDYCKIKDAVDAVLNQVITYDDQPIIAAFHSMSGGTTQSSESVWGGSIPYLVPVDSSVDTLQPNYITETTVDVQTAQEILLSAYPDLQLAENPSDWFIITERTSSDYVNTVQVGNKSLTGSQIRSLFHLNSSDFTVTYTDAGFLFTTKGNGHGVGMSQYGANEMAKEEKSYQEILAHYYPGTQLTELPDP